MTSDGWHVLRRTTFGYRRRDGRVVTQQRETYDRGNGATILLYDPERRTVLLTRQFRYPAYVNGHPDGMLIETAAGLLDDDAPEVAIRREAAEELGVAVGELQHVFDLYMSPGSVTERVHFYAAAVRPGRPGRRGRRPAEEGEDIEVLEMLDRPRRWPWWPTAASSTARPSSCCSGRRRPGSSRGLPTRAEAASIYTVRTVWLSHETKFPPRDSGCRATGRRRRGRGRPHLPVGGPRGRPHQSRPDVPLPHQGRDDDRRDRARHRTLAGGTAGRARAAAGRVHAGGTGRCLREVRR